MMSLSLLILLAACHKDRDDGPAPTAIVPVHLALGSGTLTLNPTGYAPLAAKLTFTAPLAGRVRLVIHGRHGSDSDVVQQFNDQGMAHSVAVLGLYASYDNSVDVQLVNPQGQVLADTTLGIQTGGLPANMPTSIIATEKSSTALGSAFSLVSNFSASNPQVPLMVDNYGDIRWALDYSSCPELALLSYDCGINRLKNGNFYFGDKTTSRLFEVDAFGAIVNRWDLTGYTFHHEVYEKPNGNFLVSVSKPGSTHADGSPTTEDYVVEVDRHANQLVNVWDLKQSFDETRHALEPDPVDWLHVNALLYDSTDNTIIVSGRYQGVAKLTYANRVVWLLAPHKGWGTNHQGQNLNDYLLTPLDASAQTIADTAVANGSANHPAFEWNWYQHSIQLMPNGDMLLFDNGTNRNFIRNAPTNYSRAVEYRLNPATRTVQQIWTYGKDQGAATYSAIVSRVQYLPEVNHIMFCPGYQVPNTTGSGGKIIEIDYATKQPLLQIEMSAANQWGFHRAQRMSLYP